MCSDQPPRTAAWWRTWEVIVRDGVGCTCQGNAYLKQHSQRTFVCFNALDGNLVSLFCNISITSLFPQTCLKQPLEDVRVPSAPTSLAPRCCVWGCWSRLWLMPCVELRHSSLGAVIGAWEAIVPTGILLHQGMSITSFEELVIMKHPDNGFIFIYWQPLNSNANLWVMSNFRTVAAFLQSPCAGCLYVYAATQFCNIFPLCPSWWQLLHALGSWH